MYRHVMRALIGLLMLVGATVHAQVTSFYVQPIATDTAYTAAQDSHYVAVDTALADAHKLLVFFPGTGALTKHYTFFPKLAATLGYHCVSIAYPNGYPTVAQSCAGSSDTSCYHDIRQEVCYGTDVSSHETVDTLNSIYTRLVKLLQYLDAHYPTQGWGQFLANGQPVWGMITVSGHSQGSGHALYLAKTQPCDRLIMFSGADDYSDYYSSPANWVYQAGQTPASHYFSFLHLEDDVWAYSKQYAVATASGMPADSTIVDGAQPPYGNAHCLYTDMPPKYPNVYSAKHDGPVVDFYTPTDLTGTPVYTPVWTYMLTADLGTGIAQQSPLQQALVLYPNPSNSMVYIRLPNTPIHSPLTISDMLGRMVMQVSEGLYPAGTVRLPIGNLPTGIYLVRCGSAVARLVKE